VLPILGEDYARHPALADLAVHRVAVGQGYAKTFQNVEHVSTPASMIGRKTLSTKRWSCQDDHA
jgi:hypothetical protein